MKFRFIFLRQIFFKIIFIDKYLVKKFRKKDIGIIKIKRNYFVDIPKSGSSSIKHYAALSSKRYKFLFNILGFKPVHNSVLPIDNLVEINKPKEIFLFIKSPGERLYSVYKEKVLDNNFPINFNLIKKSKFYLPKNYILKTSISKNNTFLDFCHKIKDLRNNSREISFPNNFFDKHIVSQYDHILNLQSSYPNIEEFKLIIYPIKKLNFVLSNICKKKISLKFNSTKKDNYNFEKDLRITNIIDEIYFKDKILYQKLLQSKEGFLELTYESLKDFGKNFNQI